MIISSNSGPDRLEFDALLDSTLLELNKQAKLSANKIIKLKGDKLEPFIRDVLIEKSIDTPFKGSIELISGQRFPDIIAKKYYGIEVKSTTQNHWKTTGNSVLESTRVDGVERIFMLFGKLGGSIEFRCRPYEECLSEVVVTHSPRYLIDMNLEKGKTIFDKLEIPYDILRKEESPIKPIVKYYKSLLEEGEDIWWIDQENGATSNIVIKLWNNLPLKERQSLSVRLMAFFPEMFGNSNDKFGRSAIWLIQRAGIICPNIRDVFTAGGKGDLKIGRKIYKNTPRIFINLINNLEMVQETIIKTSSRELSNYWEYKTNENKKLLDWIGLVAEQSQKVSGARHLNIKQMIFDLAASK